MPLKDVLGLTGSKTKEDDPAQFTNELIASIAQILGVGDPAAGNYSVDEVLAGIVYALRGVELELAHTKQTHGNQLALLIEQVRVLESR